MTTTAPTSVPEAFTSGFTAVVGPDGRVTLHGELDIGSLDTLRAALDVAMREPGDVLPVDAAQLTFIDSAAISELLRYQLVAMDRRRWLCLEELSPVVAQTLDAFDLRRVLTEPSAKAA